MRRGTSSDLPSHLTKLAQGQGESAPGGQVKAAEMSEAVAVGEIAREGWAPAAGRRIHRLRWWRQRIVGRTSFFRASP